MLDKMRE